MNDIVLTTGDKVQVSEEDFAHLNQFDWAPDPKGYVRRSVDNKTTFMHHEVLKRMGCEIPDGMEADHKDRNKFNNRRDNLRVVTRSVNSINRELHANVSGCPGVTYNRQDNCWMAKLQINKRSIFLGRFKKLEDAIAARKAAEKRYLK